MKGPVVFTDYISSISLPTFIYKNEVKSIKLNNIMYDIHFWNCAMNKFYLVYIFSSSTAVQLCYPCEQQVKIQRIMWIAHYIFMIDKYIDIILLCHYKVSVSDMAY